MYRMNKKYSIIVVDPPWDAKKLTHKARPNQKKMDYQTMSLEEIKSIDVGSLAEDNSMVFLWTTQKYLFDARQVLEGWGFKFLLTMVWEKTYGKSAGMPLFGFRWNAEFILVGYRGTIELWPKRKLIPAVFSAPNIRHSQKPELFQDLVDNLSSGSKLELFARRKRVGWDVWGNEVECDIQL